MQLNAPESKIGDFLSAHGGPFYEVQLRFRMLEEHSLHAFRRAVVFVALVWGMPLLLSLAEGHAFGPFVERPYLLDIGVWARFVIAIAVFTLTEGPVEQQLMQTLRQFTVAPLLSPKSFAPAAQAVKIALDERDSHWAEAICLVLAITLSLLSLFNADAHSWARSVEADGASLTMAGWWCLLFSNPFFFFLLLRGLWRHLVWSMLLRRIAALELRLVTTHPDGNGGLGFVGRYPNAFALFIFGASCVVASGLAYQLLDGSLTATAYGYVMGLWLIMVLALFAFPLFAFRAPLARLKEDTLLLTSAVGTQFKRQAERKSLHTNVVAVDPAEVEAQQEVADPGKQFEATRKMSTLLLDRAALVPLGVATLLPLVAAGATRMPYKELLSICKKLLVL
jgi:hypothetical protein